MKLKIFENAYDLNKVNESQEKRVEWLDNLDGESPYASAVNKLVAEGKIPQNEFALPLPYLSVSQVEQYMKCPQQYYRRYILGIKSAPGIAMIQGTVIHKGLEAGYRYMKKNKIVPPLEMVLDEYSGAFTKNLTSDVVLEEGETETSTRAQGEALIKEWHSKKAPLVKPVAVESQFITFYGGSAVVGAVDMVDRTDVSLSPDQRWETMSDDATNSALDVIVDNKCVKKTYTEADVANSLQMTLYAHATGIPRQRYDLYVKSKIPKLTEMLTSRNEKDVKWGAKIFHQVAQEISKGNFPVCAPQNWFCSPKYCGYYKDCRGKEE
jgi:PD-(D/E)XK nuclease superfamily